MSEEDDKTGYFKMSKAVDDFSDSYGAKEAAVAGLKIFGKGLFNVARYGVTEILPAAFIKQGETTLKSDNLADDKREKIEKSIEGIKNLKSKASNVKELKDLIPSSPQVNETDEE
jgi:hypothetical protein